YQVTVAVDGPAALAAVRRYRPAVVVLDVMLPGIDGYGVCRALRADSTLVDPMVLMLTARDGTADRVTGLDAGADDYLVKPFEHDELLARGRPLRRRRPAPCPALRPWADVTMNPATREVRGGERAIELPALEFELLRHFLRHPRQVFPRQQLLDAVWGGGNAGTSNVVDVYVGYLRAKLEAGGETRLVHTARGVGYALRA